MMNIFLKRIWLEDLIAFLFKSYPILLYYLGWLDANESFMVLVIGYLMLALRVQLWMAFSFFYDYKFRVWSNESGTVFLKLSSALGYLIGFVLVCAFWLFIYLIFFGLMFDAIDKQTLSEGRELFEGRSGSILIQTIWINVLFFGVLELMHLIKKIRTTTPENFDFMRSMLLDTPIQTMNKWSAFPMFWMIFCMMGFIFLLTARAFQAAILFFIVFDIGFALLKGLERRKNDN